MEVFILLIMIKLKHNAEIYEYILNNSKGIEDKEKFYKGFLKQCDRYGFPPGVMLQMIQVESSFNNYAVSRTGAVGLMQIQPETGKEVCKKLGYDWDTGILFDPETNIIIGFFYLS